ncbi:MAG TPA: hypothetical protein VKK79_03630, partial [Candidatus Lokiarchaeia archaeon]|nr:hypothetical protein [Candidatus Lokiarchaeia archaeon]
MRFQPFVYEKENFVESTTIYPTDIVAFLNRSQKKMYLWAGKQANGASVAEARSIWSSFAKKYAEFDAFDL